MKHILITDVQYRKAFDIVSILKREFAEEHFVLGTTRGGVFCHLCYGSCDVVQLRTEEDKELFVEDFGRLLEQYRGEELIYVPVEENTTDLVVDYLEAHGDDVPCRLTYLLPGAELYKQFRNKEMLNRYCLKMGFPAPRLYEIEELERAEYPVILKPTIGSGSHGIMRLMSSEELTPEVKAQLMKERYVAQELIPNGKDVKGAFFLCKEGKVVGAYTHQRLRTSPEEGGVTVLSRMQYEERLIRQGAELLESVKWDGLVMLEYLWDERTRTYKVIEANPRLWGSIMLSEYGGAYLLTNYVRLCLGMPVKEPEIDTERYIRWLFPMDLVNLLKKRFRMPGFWNFRNQCLINWTYARKERAMCFVFFSVFNWDNVKKLLAR